MEQVVISVIGGVAEVAYASKNVKVNIVDFDDAAAEGKSGERKLMYRVRKAKKEAAAPTLVGVKEALLSLRKDMEMLQDGSWVPTGQGMQNKHRLT